MNQKKFQYLYGPVYSWRLGMSLGIDPVAAGTKVCNFDCVYCQLGPTTRLAVEREIYVPTAKIVEEVAALPAMPIDYLTFAGQGEPTLARNLGEMIQALRAVRPEKIAVITNAALIDQADVQSDLARADFVLAKFDAADASSLAAISRPVSTIRYEKILSGLQAFRKKFSGRLALQVMFVDLNKDRAPEIAGVVRDLGADEIELNTPLRPCAVTPLSETQMQEIKKYFAGLPVKTVYELKRQVVEPLDEDQTVRRHGRFRESS